ncbi:hypothetical protein N9052_01100 [bacterium]|nr:hypothetical protein [bacterium]
MNVSNSSNSLRCTLSESLVVALLKSGLLQAEQLQCLDVPSSERLKRIVLRSCSDVTDSVS